MRATGAIYFSKSSDFANGRRHVLRTVIGHIVGRLLGIIQQKLMETKVFASSAHCPPGTRIFYIHESVPSAQSVVLSPLTHPFLTSSISNECECGFKVWNFSLR